MSDNTLTEQLKMYLEGTIDQPPMAELIAEGNIQDHPDAVDAEMMLCVFRALKNVVKAGLRTADYVVRTVTSGGSTTEDAAVLIPLIHQEISTSQVLDQKEKAELISQFKV